jgi:DNA mismatch repair ATPase MutS
MTKLTRERVIREIDQLAERACLVDHRLREMEGDASYRHLSLVDVRAAFDETAQEVRLAKQFTCANRIDFRQIELILTDERQSLSAISQILDRVERRNA